MACTSAVFRADASAAIGAGHLVRCLTLARAVAVRGWRCRFAIRERGPAHPLLGSTDFEILPIGDEGNDAQDLRMGCPEGTGLLVVDHYGLDHSFEASCRGWAERILVIDDLANRAHDADFLIDQTYGRTAKDYETLVPGSCRLLLGSAHTLLRPEFAACREASVERRNASTALHRILVSVGSSDPCNFTQIVLDGIARSNAGAAVDVVLGSSAPGLQGVRAKAECSAGEIKVHTDVCAGELSELMMRADLAIGSGGIAIWERCCLGMPSLVVCAADNQRDVVDHLATAGAIRLLGDAADVGAEQIADAVTAMAEDDDARRKLGRAASRICDGKGVERVMDAVLAEIG